MTKSSVKRVPAGAARSGRRRAAAWAPAELSEQRPSPLDRVPSAAGRVPSALSEGADSRSELASAAEGRGSNAEGRDVAEAYARGLADGRLAAEDAARERLRTAVEGAERALAELRAGEARWTGALEDNVCALAVAVARQIVGRELRGDAETVGELVRRAVQEFPVDQPLVIRVHPADLAMLSESGADADVASGRAARWLGDERVGRGGCVVEGRDRIIDGRVDTALERVYRRLTGNNA